MKKGLANHCFMPLTVGQSGREEKAKSVSSEGVSYTHLPSRKYRVAALLHKPLPYFCKFFQHLGAHPQVDLTVYFYSDMGSGTAFDPGYHRVVRWDTELFSGYKHRFPHNYSPRPALNRFTGMFHPAILYDLAKGYDAVLVEGWWGLTSTLSFATAFIRGIPVLLHSDKNVIESRTAMRQFIRNLVLGRLFKMVSAFLVAGERNGAFYKNFGVGDDKMFHVPFAVENTFFQEEARRLRPERRNLRRRLGIPEKSTVITYVGRLIRGKGLEDLLQAFRQIEDETTHLVLVGDGPERTALEERTRSYGLRNVVFAGFQNYTQISTYYALSDVFVLASYAEQWGAVVNEAMNFALPIVASNAVGAAADLVADGSNGFLFLPGDVNELARHLSFLAKNPDTRRLMGEESLRRIATWDMETAVEGAVSALQTVVS